jgi:phosphate/phosphite/phosphonate ABC transporter binding protein
VDVIRFGISRNHGGLRLVEGGNRFAAALGAALDSPSALAVAFDYEHLLRELLRGAVEVAWMPPLVHVRATAEGAMLAAVSQRNGGSIYRSALLVRKDSPHKTIGDLKRARIAWVDRHSASGYVFPRLHLINNGLRPEKDFAAETFFGNSAQACAAVVAGKADVCACFVSAAAGATRGGAETELRRVLDHIGERLRVLDVTESIPPDGFVIAPTVDKQERRRVREALLALHRSDGGAAALKMLLNATRLVAVSDEVQRSIAKLEASLREKPKREASVS